MTDSQSWHYLQENIQKVSVTQRLATYFNSETSSVRNFYRWSIVIVVALGLLFLFVLKTNSDSIVIVSYAQRDIAAASLSDTKTKERSFNSTRADQLQSEKGSTEKSVIHFSDPSESDVVASDIPLTSTQNDFSNESENLAKRFIEVKPVLPVTVSAKRVQESNFIIQGFTAPNILAAHYKDRVTELESAKNMAKEVNTSPTKLTLGTISPTTSFTVPSVATGYYKSQVEDLNVKVIKLTAQLETKTNEVKAGTSHVNVPPAQPMSASEEITALARSYEENKKLKSEIRALQEKK